MPIYCSQCGQIITQPPMRPAAEGGPGPTVVMIPGPMTIRNPAPDAAQGAPLNDYRTFEIKR